MCKNGKRLERNETNIYVLACFCESFERNGPTNKTNKISGLTQMLGGETQGLGVVAHSLARLTLSRLAAPARLVAGSARAPWRLGGSGEGRKDLGHPGDLVSFVSPGVSLETL